MNRIISANINGFVFQIDELAYDRLKQYLESLRLRITEKEVYDDIENRIAEIFLSNLKNNKQVITAENVDKLIEKMGTIADFTAVEEEEIPEESETSRPANEDFYKYVTPPDAASGGYKTFGWGLGAGFDYYVADNLYLGLELNLTSTKVSDDNVVKDITTPAGASNVTSLGSTMSYTNIGAAHGSVRIGWRF